MVLTKANLEDYLKTHYPSFCTGPLSISLIGDDEEDNPGVINPVFRVKNGSSSLIVKQGQPRAASGVDLTLPLDRNAMECESLRLRGAILPDMIPKVYYHDPADHVFLMEDVSYLEPSRYLLTSGVTLPHFGEQVARFCAANSFYLSEFYLDTDLFRALSAHFTNSQMRQVMEQWVFLRHTPYDQEGLGDPALKRSVNGDKALECRIHLLRHKFMTQAECLVHADTHTSNIFADENAIKVLDMEYTFAGPIGYDLGYFFSSILSQYASATFRDFPSEGERRDFKGYILRLMESAYSHFIGDYSRFWDEDAKPLYRDQAVFRDKLLEPMLGDVLGYTGVPMLLQSTVTLSPLTEFGVIQDPVLRGRALALNLFLARFAIMKGEGYPNMASFLSDLVEVERIFQKNMA